MHPTRRYRARPPWWLAASSWGVRRWRAVLVGAMVALVGVGALLFGLGLAARPGGFATFTMVLGVVIGGWALLRIPLVLRFVRARDRRVYPPSAPQRPPNPPRRQIR